MNVELYVEGQNENLHETLWAFHHFILNRHPAIKSTIKYGVPFYVLKKNLCYLCVQQGKVVIGIIDAHLQPAIFAYLDFTGRTQVGHFVWHSLDDRCFNDLHQLLTLAIDFNLTPKAKG